MHHFHYPVMEVFYVVDDNRTRQFHAENKSLADMVFLHMQEGILYLDSQLNIISINPWAEKVIGYQAEEIIGNSYSLLFHDQSEFERYQSKVRLSGNWKGELLKKRKNGEIYIEYNHINVVLDAEGQISNFVVVFRDMSKQKDSQKERKLARKVLENISEGVIITDANGSIMGVNPAFEIVTGYTEKEVLGRNPNIFQSGLHDQAFYQKMWHQLTTVGKWDGEIWNKKKNGEVFPEWLMISTIKDSKGKTSNYVAVFSDITDRKDTEEKLRRLAHFDSLTGVANRYSLNKTLDRLIRTATKYNQQLAVLFLDLDRFKQINDTLGHSYGDLLLKEVSLRLKGLLKNKDMIARLGGDEFVIVLTNMKHAKEAANLAEEIIQALTKSFLINHHEVFISTSIGISLFPLDGSSMEILLRNADKAMYNAKSLGRNQYEFYHTDMHHNESSQMKMEILLRKAIEREELFLVYHPQIEIKTGQVVGVEALLRWKQKELGIIRPDQFIPLAEETGLIIPISEWVIRQACEDIKKLHLRNYSQIRVSVNISALHFNQENFVKSVETIFDQANINPHFVEFELTESMIMPNAASSINKLVRLKKLGIKLSVDDFGTGYSSLSYLNRFPLDTLKIDKSFINNFGTFHDDTSLVEAMIMIAQRLRLAVVAEGVENRKQLELLKKEGCDIIQGYYITKPLPFSELLDFLDYWDGELLD